ncbi:hypothetical protein MAUB1S_03000 [Mycolicibacterium aubagnense]
MIIKRTRGVDARKALAYDYGPGRADEHHNPRRVAGTVPGRDWRARARVMADKIRADGDHVPGKRGRVIRLAVAAAPQDRILGDREWATIAHRVVDEFSGGKADGYAWEAVRHDKSHIHITLLARGHDGQLISESHDFRRYGRISDGLERDYQLTRVERGPGRPKPNRAAARAAVERQRGKAAAPTVERSTPAAQPRASRPAPGGLRPPDWSNMSADERAAWYRENIAPHPDRVRAFRLEARTQRLAPGRDRTEPQRADPGHAGGDSRPNVGWDSPGVARRLGPRPPDWDQWPERRQREWIRDKIAEYQRERGERGRDNGRER